MAKWEILCGIIFVGLIINLVSHTAEFRVLQLSTPEISEIEVNSSLHSTENNPFQTTGSNNVRKARDSPIFGILQNSTKKSTLNRVAEYKPAIPIGMSTTCRAATGGSAIVAGPSILNSSNRTEEINISRFLKGIRDTVVENRVNANQKLSDLIKDPEGLEIFGRPFKEENDLVYSRGQAKPVASAGGRGGGGGGGHGGGRGGNRGGNQGRGERRNEEGIRRRGNTTTRKNKGDKRRVVYPFWSTFPFWWWMFPFPFTPRHNDSVPHIQSSSLLLTLVLPLLLRTL